MTNAELDERILANCDARFRKVARVIHGVMAGTDLEGKEWGGRAVTKRIRVLVRDWQLEAAGNIYNWRASEIRLPAGGGGDS